MKEGTPPRVVAEKERMDANRIKKYFSQKPKTLWTVIAGVLVVVGFFFLIFLPWQYDTPGIAMMIAGAIVFLLVNLQIKDGELSEAAKEVLAKFQEKFEYEFIYQDPRKLHQAQLQGIHHKDPVYESSYLVAGEGLLSRRGNDGKIRTSVYQCVGLIIEDTHLCFGVQNFSLIGGEQTAPTLMRLTYSELSRVALGEAYPQMHLTTMGIYGAGGECLMRCQMKADAQTDELIADINNKIRKAALVDPM